MSVDAGDALVRALHRHNPWWEEGVDAFDPPRRHKSDFYHLARPDRDGSQFEDQPILGLVGRRGVGKTTLVHQFVQHRIEAGEEPERFCYLPFDADPLYQLRSDEQLRRAVRYYESRVLGRVESPSTHFLIVDDAHRIEHSTKPSIDGWGAPVGEILEGRADRHVAVTASAGVQIERELERVGVDDDAYAVQPVLPEKFRDYLFSVYPALEEPERRVSPTSVRRGDRSLPAVLDGAPVASLIAELREKYDKAGDLERRVQSQVVDYLAMGGVISFDRDGPVASARELDAADYDRLRESVRDALYREVPGFESIRTIADLERLCALAARNRGTEPLRFQELVELFDVDRRTIADTYVPALAELYLLTGVTEYDNRRPRSVRLYLRDTGLATALSDGDATAVLNDFDKEADLARVAAFDHTMRFAYGVNAAQGRSEDPSVSYWRGEEGEVDFVFEVAGTPVPVGLVYRPRTREATLGALREFRETYEAPVGFLVTGDTARGDEPIAEIAEGIVRLPYWLYLLLC